MIALADLPIADILNLFLNCYKTLPTFPTDAFPAWLKGYVEAVSKSYHTDVSMVANPVLGLLGACCQRHVSVHVYGDWREPCVLDTITIAESGKRKSSVLREVSGEIEDFEAMTNEALKPIVDYDAAKICIYKAKVKALEKAAGNPKCPDMDAALESVRAAQSKLRELEKSAAVPIRLIVDDITPEKAKNILAKNGGSLTVLSSDSKTALSILARQYTDGKSCYSGYSEDRIIVDRIGRCSDYVENPRLGLVLMVQPGIMAKIMKNADFMADGLLARILYCYPREPDEKSTIFVPPVPHDLKSQYSATNFKILSYDTDYTLELSDDALWEMDYIYKFVKARSGKGFFNHWVDKFAGTIARIAGVLHCVNMASNDENPSPDTMSISREELLNAARIGEFYYEHAKYTFGLYAAEPANVEGAKYIWYKLEGYERISKRDLLRLCGRFKSVKEMEPGLQELVRRGYIRIEATRTRGRKAITIFPNPDAPR